MMTKNIMFIFMYNTYEYRSISNYAFGLSTDLEYSYRNSILARRILSFSAIKQFLALQRILRFLCSAGSCYPEINPFTNPLGPSAIG